MTASWYVGSARLSATTLVCNGVDIDIDPGLYYLRDADGDLGLTSILSAGVGAIVPGATAYIGRDRLVRFNGAGNVLTLAVPSALQPLLGLGASPTPSTLVVASTPSTLLWSPGFRAHPIEHPLGVGSRRIAGIVQTASPDGAKIRTTIHNTQHVSGWRFRFVVQARAWTSAEIGGEFRRFFDDVLAPGFRFKHYDEIDEGDSATSVTWTTAFGPYVSRSDPGWWSREIDVLDTWAKFELRAIVTSEIDNG